MNENGRTIFWSGGDWVATMMSMSYSPLEGNCDYGEDHCS